MKKIITISTLTAGIGVSALGLNANHADAAEYNHNPAPQHNQFGGGYQQPQFNQQSVNYNQSTTSSSITDGSTSSSSSSTTTTSSTQTTSSTSGNLYTAGQCTWYVYDRVGGNIGSTWGNANNWASAASAAGYTVNQTPEKGAILQTSEGTYGHVAYVESVNSDGSITVSEMNYSGGPFVKDTRTISASQASAYNYIHLS
ncbi:CHAP domain-containing protein [Staphylococcus borealis]|uniref:CHAP domain-containing protein n=1 Tax=Staphylococcus borealis TaxID=2742203 RepID=UPI00265C0785|nr:CHAP domain-containing protein [Staphylococcus borealis]MDO0994317.1 CHAP domain-containing protein [Staphylococcus borealis]